MQVYDDPVIQVINDRTVKRQMLVAYTKIGGQQTDKRVAEKPPTEEGPEEK